MPHIPVTRGDALYFVSYMADLMSDIEIYYNIKYEILEKRFKSFKGHKMVKLKVIQTDTLKNQRLISNYCVSGPNHTFLVMHADVYFEDLEYNIKDLSLRSR